MLFLWFDHRLIEAWLERTARGLRPELQGEHAAPPDDGPLQGLKVPMIEALPEVPGEAIERRLVHSLDEAAPALDHDGRRARLERVRLRQHGPREVVEGQLGRGAAQGFKWRSERRE